MTVRLWYMKMLVQCSAAVKEANRLLEITGKAQGINRGFFGHCITHELYLLDRNIRVQCRIL